MRRGRIGGNRAASGEGSKGLASQRRDLARPQGSGEHGEGERAQWTVMKQLRKGETALLSSGKLLLGTSLAEFRQGRVM